MSRWDKSLTLFSQLLKSDLAQLPTEGYNIDQYSEISIKRLEWLIHSQNLWIPHALNVDEHRIPNTQYLLQAHTGYEFQGCLYHGCQVCYPDTKRPLTNQSSNLQFLKSKGYNYQCFWKSSSGIKNMYQSKTQDHIREKQKSPNLQVDIRSIHFDFNRVWYSTTLQFVSENPWM